MNLVPIFNKNSDLIGWHDGVNIFEPINMSWIAFINNGFVWNSRNMEFIGKIINLGCFIDVNGKPFGWVKGTEITSTLPYPKPFTPFRPFTPFTPFRPFTPLKPFTPFPPLGGWSTLREDFK